MPHLAGTIARGLRHKGFAFIDVLQICATYFNMSELYDRQGYELAGHDPGDFSAACRKAGEWDYNNDGPIAFGVFYEKERATFEGRFRTTTIPAGNRLEQIRVLLDQKR